MKKRIRNLIAGLLVATILICPAFAMSFPDVDEYSEYIGAIDYVSDIGIMIGDTNGNFNPNKIVSRAEMATIVCRLIDEDRDLSTDGSVFTDVPSSHWANKYIAKAASLGIVNGYGNNRFGPDDVVTYEQAVTMIVRTFGGGIEAMDMGGYPDGFIYVAKDNGLLDRVYSNIGEPLSRADVAMILYNCLT